MTLISPEALAECLLEGVPLELAGRTFTRNHVRVVDVRWYVGRPGEGRAAYEEGHVPGAIHLDVDRDLADPPGAGRHPLPAPDAFRGTLERAGIGSEDAVVAYDDVGGWVAARLWWMLDDLGHAAAAVLDGGLAAWIEAGLPLTTDVPSLPRAHLALADRWSKVIDRDELRAALGEVVLVDARAGERYRGEIEPIDRVAGHIPTAISAPTGGNTGTDGRFRSAAELASRFADLTGAVSGDRPRSVVTYCGSGVAACQNALAMRIAGLPDPLLYPGSYSDWTQAGVGVATGPEPGAPEVAGTP